jgi:hypothetical protein
MKNLELNEIQLISNDKGKDLMNRAEKTLLLRNILNF